MLQTQEHVMGCGLSCVAYVCDITYNDVFEKLSSDDKIKASTVGFMGWELIRLLKEYGKIYEGSLFVKNTVAKDIIFIQPNDKYPFGHWIVDCGFGFFNSWSNIPRILPIQSKIEAKICGIPDYVLYQK